jgi:hypothetical protein
MDNRNLQNIVITYPRDEPAAPPTQAPTRMDKNTLQVVCQPVEEGVNVTRTEVKLLYLAETDSPEGDLNEEYLNEELPALVQGASVETAAEYFCDGAVVQNSTTATTDGGARRLALSDCIVLLSTGPLGVLKGNCTPTLDESESCNEYSDSFFILHTDECTPSEVIETSISLISTGVTLPVFYEAVNARSKGTLVTKVSVIADPSISSAEAAVGPAGLTAGGIALVTLVVLASLLIFAFLFVWRRHVVRRNRRLAEDNKSIRTSWSQQSKDGDGSYLTADFNDLARRHTKLNVHKCKSAFCEVCRPNLGVVHMLSVPRESNNFRVCGLIRNSTMDSRVSSLGDPEEQSFGPQPDNYYDEPLALEPFDDSQRRVEVHPSVVVSVEEVEAEDGEVSYVKSAHAKRSDRKKSSSASNQVLL